MFISDKELAARLSISRSTVWRWIRENHTFPRPYALSSGCKRWKLTEVDEWVETLQLVRG
ncbi:helix-turn-helix transcriptional regulator [Sulfitobacter sp. 1A15333]|uniref:helix-turn-helix transcriptional regulator n=1 Tax=Sulfitobacter sp. 1A15333 TaxID=3368570 RepID=UPI0037460430